MKTYLGFIKIFGLVTFAIGMSTVCGYISGSENLYHWGKGVPMAINTGIAFLSEGIAIILIARVCENLLINLNPKM